MGDGGTHRERERWMDGYVYRTNARAHTHTHTHIYTPTHTYTQTDTHTSITPTHTDRQTYICIQKALFFIIITSR